MPSPFPGMDPYLESPEFFHGLHNKMIISLEEALQARLPEPYYADDGERVWVEVSERVIEPDVHASHPAPTPFPPNGNGSATAVLSVGTRPVVIHVPHDERRETFVNVLTRQGSVERLVTTIEILSPINKRPGDRAQDLYLQKQREILDSQVHLVEIDLLRGGQHTTAVPRERLAEAGPSDYHVCIHCFDAFQNFYVYPIRLQDRLPTIAIPLLPGDPAVPIDLQAIFDHSYDIGPYRRRLRYSQATPEPPLRPEQAAWAAQILRDKGLA